VRGKQRGGRGEGCGENAEKRVDRQRGGVE